MSSNDFSDYFEGSWEQSIDDIQWGNQNTTTSDASGHLEEFAHAAVSSTYWLDAIANPGSLHGADDESSEMGSPIEDLSLVEGPPAVGGLPAVEGPPAVENTLTVAPLDTIAQPAPPSSLRLPTIVVNRSLDRSIIQHLQSLGAPQVTLFVMELGNVCWNFSFTQSFSRNPTKAVCQQLITQACDRRTKANPSWHLEVGAYCCARLFYFCR